MCVDPVDPGTARYWPNFTVPCIVLNYDTASLIGWLFATNIANCGALYATAPTCRILNCLLIREVKAPKRDMQRMYQSVHLTTDLFKPHFDIPSLPSNLVFDFESFDDDDDPVSTKHLPKFCVAS